MVGSEVCQRRASALQFVDVFDGAPQELATLVPEPSSGDSAGHWKLGYVYDAGRRVTVRCKYADGKQIDTALTQRVERCDFRLGADRTLDVTCR